MNEASCDRKQHLRRWPLWILVAAGLPTNLFVLPWLVDRAPSYLAEPLLVGVLAGECCFVVLLSALTSRTWLSGFLLGSLVLLLGGGALALGLQWFEEPVDFIPFFWGTLFLLLGACPLLVLRQVRGWRLIDRRQAVPIREPLAINDLLSVIAVTGAAIVLLRAPMVIWELDASLYWGLIAVIAAVTLSVGVLTLPLAAKFAFTLKTRIGSAVALAILAVSWLIPGFAIVQVIYCWENEWQWEWYDIDVPRFLTGYAAATTVFYVSLGILAASGIALVRVKRASKQDESSPARSPLRLMYVQIVAVVLIASAVSMYLRQIESGRAAKDRQNARIAALAEQLGGQVYISQRVVYAAEFPDTDDDEMARFSVECSSIESLELSGLKFTDAGLAHVARFKQLNQLVLSNTSVTDAGLMHLRDLDLSTLHLQDTAVTGSGLANVRRAALTELDLEGSPIDDAGLVSLGWMPHLYELRLSDTNVTDSGLAQLRRIKRLDDLDLSGTDIDGHGLSELPGLAYLNLARTKVTDASLEALSDWEGMHSLSLSETAVTDALFSHLTHIDDVFDLDLSQTSVTDVGVAMLGNNPHRGDLNLSGTKITGTGFANWKHLPGSLNLSRTDVDAEGFAALRRKQDRLAELSLADTKITDEDLAALVGITWNLDLSNTAVTASGIVAAGFPELAALFVAKGQFSEADLAWLQRNLPCYIQVEDPDEGE